jgi:hypothetical protein
MRMPILSPQRSRDGLAQQRWNGIDLGANEDRVSLTTVQIRIGSVGRDRRRLVPDSTSSAH